MSSAKGKWHLKKKKKKLLKFCESSGNNVSDTRNISK